ncbi:MAG: TetR/AcrR family transcriptional regulator [Alphaproteobacteria bacterium]|nr:TetR/AcrR family transcriptional regulator [Alphaproteobacteria bacterium]
MAKRPIDRRVARSRKMLHQAFHSLIIKKGYDAVTVEDICEAANVGRSTFYAHFTSKDDLMRSGAEHMRRQILDRQKSAAGSADKETRGLGFSLTMFEHARDHVHNYQALVGSRGGAVALGTIREILCDCVRSELAAIGDKNPKDGIPREFIVLYVVGAYMAVLTWWLDGGAKLPPAKIDAMFRRLATKGVFTHHEI